MIIALLSQGLVSTIVVIPVNLACSAGIFWAGETLFVWPVRVRNIVVAAIFDFMTVEDWGE